MSMSWQTPVKLEALGLLSLSEPILTMGSCFAEHLGDRLLRYKWNCLSNPFGTLFHPLTISRLLTMVIKGESLARDGFISYDGSTFHFDLPSTFYGRDSRHLEAIFKATAAQVCSLMDRPFWILLTLGTAFVYENLETHQLVANCHRQPAELYSKRLLTLEEIDQSFCELYELLPEHARLLWTLSPVRHTRETLPLNMVSKSLLRIWIHQWLEKNPERNFYFPAYEILLDELRDYRYYSADLIHPSESAVEEIWLRFQDHILDPESRDFARQWSQMLRRLDHRPMRPEAPSYREFLSDSIQLLECLTQVDVSSEKSALRGQLNSLPRA